MTTLFVAVKDRKVVFLDIDEFKEFNTAHTEPVVGRNLLPRFTLALEAHVHHHGDAYRQGGDEYRVLLPGESRPLAVAFLAELRAKVAAYEVPPLPPPEPDKGLMQLGKKNKDGNIVRLVPKQDMRTDAPMNSLMLDDVMQVAQEAE